MFRIALALSALLILMHTAFAVELPSPTTNSSSVLLNHDTRYPISIIPYIYYYVDTSQQKSIETIRQSDIPWKKSHSSSLNFGLIPDPVWIKLEITNTSELDDSFYLEIPFPVIDYVHLYQIENSKIVSTASVGDMFPFAQRPVEYRNFLIPLELKPNQNYEIYASFQLDGSLQIEASISPTKTFWQDSQISNFAGDIYYGIMIAMIAYNLFFFFVTREISYIHYSLYVISFTFFNATIRGYGLQLLWPNSTEWNGIATPFFIFSSIAFLSFFSATFLRLDNQKTGVHTFLSRCGFIALFLIASAFILPKAISIFIGGILAIPACAVAIIASWRLILSGYKPARYFCLALSAFLFSVVILIFNKFGFIESNFFTEYAAQIGSAIEAILLSLAQADKMQAEKKELYTAKEEALQRSNKLKDEFLATISHEFRTPMSGLIGCLDLARSSDSKTSNDELLTNARDSAHHLKHLLDNVLLYSEALNGTLKAESKPIAFKEWLEEHCLTFENKSNGSAVSFQKVVSCQIPDIITLDSIRLGQVLEHILINAFKFTEKGTITLTIDVQQKKSMQTMLTFEVSDSGIGMTAEQLNEVFNLFKQADGSHRRKYGGLGVGTAVCKALVESMKGCISIQSEYGAGTTVFFAIPIEYSTIPEKIPIAEIVPAEKTILIVEDNPVNRLVLHKLLKREGFNVICAENGKEGVDKVKDRTVDLVLMDCQMPIMDGFEAVTIIRKMPTAKATIPIIAVTANTMSNDKQHCLDVGMDDYVPKPISPAELESKIYHWLNKA